MVDLVLSKQGVPIRLTDERWAHITEEHVTAQVDRLKAEGF